MNTGVWTSRTFGVRTFGFVVAATVATTPLSAQKPVVKAHLAPAEVEVGELFKVVVEISGVRKVEDVFIPPLFRFPGRPQDGLLPFATEITNPEAGQPGGLVVFSYSYVAAGAGTVEIGPILVTADGSTLETEALTLSVKDPETVTVRAHVEPAEVRELEEFTVHVEVDGVESILEPPVLRDLSHFARRSGGGGGARNARLDYVALKAGTHDIGPVSVKVGNSVYESEPLTVVVSDEPPVVEVVAALNTEQAWVGGDFVLVVTVEGVREMDEVPMLPDMSSFARLIRDDFGGGGFGGSGYYSEGEYRFRALKPGEFTIGPIRVETAGQSVQTEPMRLTIGETPPEPPVSPEDLRATAEADKRRVYVGEPVIVSYGFLSRGSRLYGAGEWSVQYDAWNLPPREGLQVQQVPRRYHEQERVFLDGRWYQPYTLTRLAVVPGEPGETTIGPAELKVQVNRRSESYLRRGRSEWVASLRGTWTPMTLTTDPISIEVVPLPDEGRPESFRGHVGRVEMVAWVDRTEGEVGDTVTLHIELSGDGHSSFLPEPEIALPAGFDVSDPQVSVSDPRGGGGEQRGTRVYTYRLAANREGTFQIPVLEVSWFDSESESYGTSRAGPFEFTALRAGREQAR